MSKRIQDFSNKFMHTHLWHLMTEVMWTCYCENFQVSRNFSEIQISQIPYFIKLSIKQILPPLNVYGLYLSGLNIRITLWINVFQQESSTPTNEPMTQQHIHQTSRDTQIWPFNNFDVFKVSFHHLPSFHHPSSFLVLFCFVILFLTSVTSRNLSPIGISSPCLW